MVGDLQCELQTSCSVCAYIYNVYMYIYIVCILYVQVIQYKTVQHDISIHMLQFFSTKAQILPYLCSLFSIHQLVEVNWGIHQMANVSALWYWHLFCQKKTSLIHSLCFSTWCPASPCQANVWYWAHYLSRQADAYLPIFLISVQKHQCPACFTLWKLKSNFYCLRFSYKVN